VTESIHKLGEVLRAAREAKGVDLARIERETKIRTRYLSALEHGEYRELPGTVYTKGFLRNYGSYLGLDPEYLVDLYRLETAGNGVAERPSPAPPRPMNVRRARAFVVTPGAIAAAILTVAVLAFVGYLVYEFVTFARTPDLQLTSPAGDVANYRELEYTITGTTVPNAQVTIDGPSSSRDVTADSSGNFSVVMQLVPGSNVFTVVANDPVTHRDSAQQTRTIDVNLSSASPSPGAAIALTGPKDGATVTGAVTATGTAPAGTTVHVEATLGTAAGPGFTIKTASGQAVKVPTLAAGTTVTSDATAAQDGTFTASLQLAPGTWQLSVVPGAAAASGSVAPSAAASSATPAGSPAPGASVQVTVKPASGLVGGLRIAGGPSYLIVLQDNVPLAGVSGHTLAAGKSVSLKAKTTLVVRAGNAGAVTMTINGVSIGTMGGSGQVIEWHVQATS
jgi:cytoskeletal protein RodZ